MGDDDVSKHLHGTKLCRCLLKILTSHSETSTLQSSPFVEIMPLEQVDGLLSDTSIKTPDMMELLTLKRLMTQCAMNWEILSTCKHTSKKWEKRVYAMLRPAPVAERENKSILTK